MISVKEAKQIINQNVSALLPVTATLANAVGKTLAADIFATISIPAYPQSSMDGYAFRFSDFHLTKPLIINGEIAAGSNERLNLLPGHAARIFTGAPLPGGADTVVMQEKVRVENSSIHIDDDKLQHGTNVRPIGSEIKQGDLAIAKNSVLTPAAIGFLAGIGLTEVTVYPTPKVSIILTGNELQKPGLPLQYGQVYESNSFALQAALKQLDIIKVNLYNAKDSLEAVTEVLENALNESDVVLLTGGVSVGDYDFVVKASAVCGIQPLFHKIKQRPGKPLFFGKKDNKVIFGLPGNPSSVLTCFYEYVMPALGHLSKNTLEPQTQKAELANNINKPATVTQFLKAYFDGEKVTALDAQESYRMQSFARANCFIVAEEEVSTYESGDTVEIHLLPC